MKLADERIDVAASGAAERVGGVVFAVAVAVAMGVVNLA
jgi:hypothetical protein